MYIRKILSSLLPALGILLLLPSYAETGMLPEKLINAIVLHINSSKAFVRNIETKIDAKPVIKNNRTFVPMRFITENIGADVKWDNFTSTAVITFPNKKVVKLTIGDKRILVDQNVVALDAAPEISEDRIIVPLRNLSELAGQKVFWDPSGLIIISDKENILKKETDAQVIDRVNSLFQDSTANTASETKLQEDKNIKETAAEHQKGLSQQEPSRNLNSLVKPSVITAEIIEDTQLFEYTGVFEETTDSLEKGSSVEVMGDFQYEWYQIRIPSEGEAGWVPSWALSIPPDPETNTSQMTQDEIEGYINEQGFESESGYLIWADLDRQLTHIFLRELDNWKLYKSMQSSSGKNVSPTIRGTFNILDRGEWFYNDFYQSGAMNWVQFSGDYLFHSLPMDYDGNIQDETLGKRASSGCIRLSLEDSRWVYDYVPDGTTVFIN